MITPMNHVSGFFALFTALAAAFATPLRAAEPARPNILLFITDDQSWLDSGAYGAKHVRTPNFDRIAREGVLFTHGFVSAPSCTPSRAAILTGRNFWELEQGAFLQAYLPSKFAVLPDLFEAQGYAAGFTGKGWGPGDLDPAGRARNPAGNEWNRIRIPDPGEGLSNIDYPANFRAFLKSLKPGQPFFFWAGALEPHHPHGEKNFEQMPGGLAAAWLPGFIPDTEGIRKARLDYLYEVEYADRQLGAFLAALEEAGILDNTLVLATADNGTPIPRAKSNLYDWGVRVPLAAMWKSRAKPGRVCDDPVGGPDFAPTFLEAAAIPVPPEMSGRSLLNILLSEKSGAIDPSRDSAAFGLEWHDRPFPMRGIRTRQHLYIRNYTSEPRTPLAPPPPRETFESACRTRSEGVLLRIFGDHPSLKRYYDLCSGPRPPEELYDCARDPEQVNNLAADPQRNSVKEDLRAKLEALQRKTRDPRITGDMAQFESALKYCEEKKARTRPAKSHK